MSADPRALDMFASAEELCADPVVAQPTTNDVLDASERAYDEVMLHVRNAFGRARLMDNATEARSFLLHSVAEAMPDGAPREDLIVANARIQIDNWILAQTWASRYETGPQNGIALVTARALAETSEAITSTTPAQRLAEVMEAARRDQSVIPMEAINDMDVVDACDALAMEQAEQADFDRAADEACAARKLRIATLTSKLRNHLEAALANQGDNARIVEIPHPTIEAKAEVSFGPYRPEVQLLVEAAKRVKPEDAAKLVTFVAEHTITVAEHYEPGKTVSVQAIAKKYAGSEVADLIERAMVRPRGPVRVTIRPIPGAPQRRLPATIDGEVVR